MAWLYGVKSFNFYFLQQNKYHWIIQEVHCHQDERYVNLRFKCDGADHDADSRVYANRSGTIVNRIGHELSVSQTAKGTGIWCRGETRSIACWSAFQTFSSVEPSRKPVTRPFVTSCRRNSKAFRCCDDERRRVPLCLGARPSARERKPGAFPRVLEHRQNPLRALWRSLCAQEILTTLSRQSEDRTRRGERRLKASDSHYWECTYDASACWMSITMRFPLGIRDGCCKNRRFSGD